MADLEAALRPHVESGEIPGWWRSSPAGTTDQTAPQHREMGGFFLDGQGWGSGGGVDTEVLNPWNVIGRYGWVGGTGTATYVDPRGGVVSVILTQVELGGADSAGVLESFWTAAAS